MCKKLFVLCLVVVAVLSLSASAGNSPITASTPLKVDIDGDGAATKAGYMSWAVSRDFTGPISQEFDMGAFPYDPLCQIDVYRNGNANPHAGFARNRSGGLAGVLGTGDYSTASQGFGMTYVSLTIGQGLDLGDWYKVSIWAMEARNVWSQAADNPESKYVAWSQTNPKDWLDTNYSGVGGEPPNGGYGPIVCDDIAAPQTDSNMPGSDNNPYTPVGTESSLYDLLLARTSLIAENGDNHLGHNVGKSTFWVQATDDGFGNGVIVLYGWMDATDWTGSMHVPICGFRVIPEPATIALLGLGGLALLRRKKT